jgi:hypothetical protein
MADAACPSCNPPSDLLRRLEVRPIRPEERGAWDALVAAHQYLGLRSLFGKTLRYVATVEGRWLALLGWQGAALKCAARDAWIGWPRVLHYQRLHLLANNARFLILPDVRRVPNLASRVLALNLRRPSADWQRVHGHPLLLAETFVDPARFTGACYRAANWQVVGTTREFARRNARYAPHGEPKQALVYPLHAHARALLCAPTLPVTPLLERVHASRCFDHRPAARSPTAPQSRAHAPPAPRAAPSRRDGAEHRHRRRARRAARLYRARRVGRGAEPSPPQAPARPLQSPHATLRAALRADAAPRAAKRRCRRRRCRVPRLVARRHLCAETLDKGHGRLEQRRLLASTTLNDYVNFPHVAQVAGIERAITTLKSGQQRHETVFVVTSLPPEQASAYRLLQLNRGHWGIENRSHYVRDLTYDEDRSRIRVGNGPAIMASLRNFASALRAFAHHPGRALAAIGV